MGEPVNPPLSGKHQLFRHRDEDKDHGRGTYIELFFDLVFVFAMT